MNARWWPPLATLLLVTAIWQGVCWAGLVRPYVLPSPVAVLQAAARDSGTLATAAVVTATAAWCGFLLSLSLGGLIAILVSEFPVMRRAVLPYAIFLQTVPMIAVAPLIIIWIGPGMTSVALISLIVSLFPIITNGTAGLLAVPPELEDLFRLYRSTAWQRLLRLRIPHAIPYFVTGARTSAGLAVIGAIVGEFFAGDFSGSRGLGFLIPQRIYHLKTDEGFAAVLLATLLGLLLYGLVGLIRNSMLRRWCPPESQPIDRQASRPAAR